jgi:Na+-transporting methylmalonyl-CoA/oxaloacetate decarboxylase gamma subunit
MAIVIALLFLLAVLVIFVVAIRRQRLSRSPRKWDIGSDDDWPPAGVREPRRPPPTSGTAAAVAEPDEEVAEDFDWSLSPAGSARSLLLRRHFGRLSQRPSEGR